MRIFLDDERQPRSEDFDLIVRSYSEAVKSFDDYGCPLYMSFDHDLGDDKTGMDVVHYMVEKDMDEGGKFIPPTFEFDVHSTNSVGRDNIIFLLKGYLLDRKQNSVNV